MTLLQLFQSSRGVLQAANRMTIEELLNPSDESITTDETTDDEIYNAVIDSKVQRENAAANNIGDNDVDDDCNPITSFGYSATASGLLRHCYILRHCISTI